MDAVIIALETIPLDWCQAILMMHTCRMIRMMKEIINVSGVRTTTRTVKVKEYCCLIHLCRRTEKLNASSTKYTVVIILL